MRMQHVRGDIYVMHANALLRADSAVSRRCLHMDMEVQLACASFKAHLTMTDRYHALAAAMRHRSRL